MNILWFLVQVWKMRTHQIAYFKNRKQSDLIEAKKFEKIVDAELMKRLIIVGSEPTALRIEQANLFTEADNEATKDQ
jgi:hypothetical protein